MKSLFPNLVFGVLMVSLGLIHTWPPLFWSVVGLECVLMAYSIYSGLQTGRKLNFLLKYSPYILRRVFNDWNEWHGNIHDVICFEKLLPEDFREEFKKAWGKHNAN